MRELFACSDILLIQSFAPWGATTSGYVVPPGRRLPLKVPRLLSHHVIWRTYVREGARTSQKAGWRGLGANGPTYAQPNRPLGAGSA